MKFDAKNVAFGRHETFHLRFSWLSKGFKALKRNPLLFSNTDEATVTLGVGKNMVSSIRYWLKAAQLIDLKENTPTELGSYIFDEDFGKDPFLEDEGTLWLVHWLIASNTSLATTISWFFSKYHKNYFDQSELGAALSSYLQEAVASSCRPVKATIKNDISVLARLYSKTQNSTVVEDSLDSPLSELGLITEQNKGSYSSAFEEHSTLPCEVLGFAIVQLVSIRESNIISVEELTNSSENYVSPGTIFRMTESAMMVKIEELVRLYPEYFTLRETAGLRQIFVDDNVLELQFLSRYYDKNQDKLEAVA